MLNTLCLKFLNCIFSKYSFALEFCKSKIFPYDKICSLILPIISLQLTFYLNITLPEEKLGTRFFPIFLFYVNFDQSKMSSWNFSVEKITIEVNWIEKTLLSFGKYHEFFREPKSPTNFALYLCNCSYC